MTGHRFMPRRRALTALFAVLAVTAAATTSGMVASAPKASAATSTRNALVLYDTTGPYGWLGELDAMGIANLGSHFGSVKTEPVVDYQAGQIGTYTATFYAGSTYDEPLPTSFLDDVLTAKKPVVWMYDNIWQLTARAGSAAFAAKYGWMWSQFDDSQVASVTYKGQTLTRSLNNQGGIMNYANLDTTKATVLANVVRSDGTTFPWALRSGKFTYIGEIPLSYINERDRYLALSDLMFDALAPSTAVRHQALLRLEDIGPDSDPAQLEATANLLYSQGVPFSFNVYPIYRDPLGIYNNGVDTTITLSQAPAVVKAIKYLLKHGGTMVEEGVTHQYGDVGNPNVDNPYDGVSGDDVEFYLAHVDPNNYVVFDGPVPEDSTTWATNRIDTGLAQFAAVGLAKPNIWVFPHYAASAADYAVVQGLFGARYDRARYFGGQLSGGPIDYAHNLGQFFPYGVRDMYGTKVIPENLGDYEPVAENNNPPRLVPDIVAEAADNLVVRDGFASVYYLSDYGTTILSQIISGIKGLGYTFVPANKSIASVP